MFKHISTAVCSLIVAAALSSSASAQTNGQDAIYDAIGMNHEAQVAANCASEYGVSQAAAVCIVGQLTAEEVYKCLSDGFGGQGCFGDNNTLVNMAQANIDAAQREANVVTGSIRLSTGVSVRDIEENGPLGGENSDARKACDAVAGIFGGRC